MTTSKDFSFLQDQKLEKNIINSIDFMSFLWVWINDPDKKQQIVERRIRREFYRIFVLHAASIVEALLFCVYRKCGFADKTDEYLRPHALPKAFQPQAASQGEITVTLRKKRPLDDRELTFDFLVRSLRDNNVLSKSLARKVLGSKDVRNTFHLTKSREGIRCDRESANIAARTLEEVIQLTRERHDTRL